MEHRCRQYLVTNCRNVGAMFPPSIFEDRCVDSLPAAGAARPAVGTRPQINFPLQDQAFDQRDRAFMGSSAVVGIHADTWSGVSTFGDQWSMCRPSKIGVSAFEDRSDRCVDLRRWMIDVPTFEDR